LNARTVITEETQASGERKFPRGSEGGKVEKKGGTEEVTQGSGDRKQDKPGRGMVFATRDGIHRNWGKKGSLHPACGRFIEGGGEALEKK